MRSVLGALTLAAVVALVAACSSTRVVQQWTSPEYTSAAFHRILVIGVSNQPALRRSFEDEFVAQLEERGVDAVPSYRYIPESGKVAQARMQEAVRAAGADGAIVTRLVRVERRTRVSPGFYGPGPDLGFYDGYAGAWLGYYEPPMVHQYDVYISETSLWDTRNNRLVWSGSAETEAPHDVNKEIKHYVDAVLSALEKHSLLAAAR